MNYSHPIELNRYGYAAGNPVNLSDPSGNQASAEYAILLGGIGGAAFGAASDIACGGSGLGGAVSGFVMGAGFTAIALINPQAALAIGAFGAGMSIASGSLATADMLLHGPNACNSTQLVLAIVGLFGAQGFQGGPPSQQLVTSNGVTISTQAFSELVVIGNVVTTVGEIIGVLSLLMSDSGGGNGEGAGQRPGYSGPDEGWENTKPEDLTPGHKGKPLQDALASGDYLPSDNLLFAPEELKGTAKFNYVIDENGIIRVARPKVLPHHPDLVNGRNVFGAGEMIIDKNGRIVLVNDQSGHYFKYLGSGIGNKFFPYLKFLMQQNGIPIPDNFVLSRP